MSDHKQHEHEYAENWDTGTYQTGSIHAPKHSSGLVTLLLVLVIFLGGLASALGIINIRLLEQLTQEFNSTVPVSKDSMPGTNASTSHLVSIDDPLPSIPQDRVLDLMLTELPSHSADTNNPNTLSQEQIYERNAASIVEIHCLTHINSTQSGIGVVLSEDGYILTNAHVVDSAKRIFIYFSDGELVRAALVGKDSFTDLAVLYIEKTNLIPARFCSSQNLQVTDPTYAVEAIRNSDSDLKIRASGVFSVDRTLTTAHHSLPLIQTYDGNNNGPVFNSQGQIIGFQAGKVAQFFDEYDTQGLGLVIPSHTIRTIVQQLTNQGFVSDRPDLGLEMESISTLYQHYWDLPGGMLLTYIDPDSPIAALDLQVGDILLALDGHPMTSHERLYTFLYTKNIGDEVTAVIFRDEEKFTVKLIIHETEG